MKEIEKKKELKLDIEKGKKKKVIVDTPYFPGDFVQFCPIPQEDNSVKH